MNDELNLLSNPLFFASARVWRCYLGGKLLDEFLGAAEGADSNFPEDWLASVTLADNGGRCSSRPAKDFHAYVAQICTLPIFCGAIRRKHLEQIA